MIESHLKTLAEICIFKTKIVPVICIFLLISCHHKENEANNNNANKKEFDSCSAAKRFDNVGMLESGVQADYTGELKNFIGTDTTKLDFKHFFEHGKLIKSIFYFDNGAVQEEYTYKCGALHGVQKYYYRNGKLSKIIPFSYGYRQGTGELFDEAGKLRQQVLFIGDSMIGEPKNFDQKTEEEKIVLKTSSGDSVIIAGDIIHFNRKAVSQPIEAIIYSSKYNRLIEQNSSILLFLEIGESPSLNQIAIFKITDQKAVQLASSVYNDRSQGTGPAPFTDMDNDGKLELGGFDLTEYYDSKDSMYYNPSEYFEISNGNVVFDSALTKKMDIKMNGIYLKNPVDKHGEPVIVKKPANKRTQ